DTARSRVGRVVDLRHEDDVRPAEADVVPAVRRVALVEGEARDLAEASRLGVERGQEAVVGVQGVAALGDETAEDGLADARAPGVREQVADVALLADRASGEELALVVVPARDTDAGQVAERVDVLAERVLGDRGVVGGDVVAAESGVYPELVVEGA